MCKYKNKNKLKIKFQDLYEKNEILNFNRIVYTPVKDMYGIYVGYYTPTRLIIVNHRRINETVGDDAGFDEWFDD